MTKKVTSVRGTEINIKEANAIHVKLRKNVTLVFFRKSESDKINKNIKSEKLSPSKEISINLGSITNKKLPISENFIFVKFLRRKNNGITVTVEIIILRLLCMFINCNGSVLSEKIKKRLRKLAQPVFVTVYPNGKAPSKAVFTP